MTSYPGSIDGYSDIRIIRDRIDEIIAKDHNEKRDAIISIEQTLGTNPQGPFGTVKARLDDAYANIEYHVRGNQPQHADTVITSIARSGTYHSLSAGSVGSQIEELIEDINSIIYPGSGLNTFADGYALPSSALRGAVTNIVTQVGGLSGAEKIGATSFSSGQFTISGSSIKDQLESAASAINEGATFRRRVFDSFISEGLSVTNGAGVDATVASGILMSNGRIYNLSVGETVTVPTVAGTYYIYASVLNDSITLGITTSVTTATLDEETTTVLLHKIIHNGTAWTSDLDIRRFGMLDNDKNVYVVGDGLTDGYGYDFTSFNAAIENIKILRAGGYKPSPIKIILATDITVTSSIMIDISSTYGGIEIDGGFHTINLTADTPLFDVESDNITFKNINVDCNIAVSTVACFAKIGDDSSVEKIFIENCKFSSSSGNTADYFIRCGNLAGTNSVTDLYVNNNNVKVKTAFINFIKLTTTVAESLTSSVISNNIFLQYPLASSTEDAVRVAGNCVVENNKIWGYFNSGISIEFGNRTVVSNNWIFGGDSYPGTSANMSNGVLIRGNNTTPNNCIISNNIIAGITTYGIDANLAGTNVEISSNVIQNDSTPSLTMYGIRGVSDTLIESNIISSPGVYGIVGYNITGNYIYGGAAGAPTATGAIQALTNNYVKDNIIYNIDGIGIAPNYDSFISGNLLYAGSAVTTSAINDCGNNTIIEGNFIYGYGTIATAGSGIKVLSGPQSDIQISSNFFYNCIDNILSMATATNCLIGDNLISCTANTTDVIKYTGDNTLISGNLIADMPSSISYAIWVSGDKNVVSNNALLNCTGYGVYFESKDDCICNNNVFIGASGLEAIYLFGNRSIISDNYIYGYSSSSSNTVIKAVSASNDIIITGNLIKTCNGVGIDCFSSSNVIVSNNYLDGDTSASSGIIGVNNSSSVIGNIISNYGGIASSIGIQTTDGKTLIANNFITNIRSNLDYGIYLQETFCYSVTGNIIGDYSSYIAKSGIYANICTDSIISDNIIFGNKTGTLNDSGITWVGKESIVSNNFIYNSNYNGIELSDDNILCSLNYIYDCDNNGISTDTNNTNNKIIENYIITAGASGINIASGNDNSDISNNYISNTTNYGIYATTSDFLNISNNYLYSTSNRGIQLFTCANYLISNNYIYQSLEGIYVSTNCSGGKISNNYIYDVQSFDGIGLNSGCDYVSIDNNYIYTSARRGIYVASSDDVSINNNYIYNVTTSSMYIDTSYNILINSNYLNGMSEYSIHLNDSPYCLINGNIIKEESTGWGTLRVNSVSIGCNISGNYLYFTNRDGILMESDYYVINNNLLLNCGRSGGYTQINASDTYDGIISGNNIAYSLVSNTDGIDAGGAGASGILIIGNRSVAGTSADSFIYSTADSLLVGNMSRALNNPAAWGSLPHVDASNRHSS